MSNAEGSRVSPRETLTGGAAQDLGLAPADRELEAERRAREMMREALNKRLRLVWVRRDA